MKINTNTPTIKLVAHVTLNGLESLERGQINLEDPRLNESLGTFQLELHADEHTAKAMEVEIRAARAKHGSEAALHYLDNQFIKPWRVYIAMMTSGDPEIDQFTQNEANRLGHHLNVATKQN